MRLRRDYQLITIHYPLFPTDCNALSIAIHDNKIKRNDLVMMIGTGAGLSVALTLIRF